MINNNFGVKVGTNTTKGWKILSHLNYILIIFFRIMTTLRRDSMRLELFNLIDETMELLKLKNPTFQYVENKVKTVFSEALTQSNQEYISISSRIKSASSIKEKIIRNKYYLNCKHANDVLKELPDLIGITIDCRFISEENKLYQALNSLFNYSHTRFHSCKYDENLYLDFNMVQPQQQRNGFTIYRIDGYYVFNDIQINFELQIKSMVHRFWSDIEHQVVYKNTQFIYNDTFMQRVLSSVHDSLEVVDHQLQIVYQQMINESTSEADFGMGERSFKIFIAKSISDLYARKMISSLGFTTDFKKSSAVLSHYIYIQDFVRNENASLRLMEYMEHFNLLNFMEIDFTEPIFLESNYKSDDPFCDVLGKYWQSVINIDYEWHVFFYMLFLIEQGNNIQDFTKFIKVIKEMVINRSWYDTKFSYFDDNIANELRTQFTTEIAKAMVKVGKIRIIHEDKLYMILKLFQDYIDDIDEQMKNDPQLYHSKDQMLSDLNFKICLLF